MIRAAELRDRLAGLEPIGLGSGEPVAQLGGPDHRSTRQDWSGRSHASSPARNTAATGLCPNR